MCYLTVLEDKSLEDMGPTGLKSNAVFLSGVSRRGSVSLLIQDISKIQFPVVVGLKSLFLCWQLVECHFLLLEDPAFLGSQPPS